VAWNKIAIYQDAKDLQLMLNETGEYAGAGSYTGRWWMCDAQLYFRVHSPKDLAWIYVGGTFQIGGWERSGYEGKESERIFRPHVTLWPAKRDARGKLSVALASGTGSGRLDERVGPGTAGFDMKQPVTWATLDFGVDSISPGGCSR
jgi:hypothetical protein